MTLSEFMAEYDVYVVRSEPKSDGKKPSLHPNYEVHIVTPYKPREFRGPTGAEDRIGDSLLARIVVYNHPATWEYDRMPHFWRERRFPHVFERWDEPDHAAHRTPYTWHQQQVVWARRDVAEAWIDGEIDAAERDRLLSEMEPPPAIDARKMVAALARRMTVRPKAEPKGPAEGFLMASVKPVQEPTKEDAA